jgi:hypothetical protein
MRKIEPIKKTEIPIRPEPKKKKTKIKNPYIK